MHILLLTDRDWTHPQGGGTGTNLLGQVSRWLKDGHEITVIAGTYPGAEKVSHPEPGLTIHRMGGRVTLFARAPWASLRGIGRDADVVLEVVNGIAFFTPLWFWLRIPRVTLVHHVHRDHYVAEMGPKGRWAALLAEHIPLRFLYQHHPFLTISHAAKRDLVEQLHLPADRIHVSYLGVEHELYHEAPKTEHPSLLYLGRLKQYKRLEVLLDVLEAMPAETRLEIAGDGDWRPQIEADIERRQLGDRVTLHGHVTEAEKADLYAESWVNLTASSAEGWCLTVLESACSSTPSAALAVGGLPESIADGETGMLADTPEELAAVTAKLIEDKEHRLEMGRRAKERAQTFTWERTAHDTMGMLEGVKAAERLRLRDRLRESRTAAAAGLAAATLMNNAIQLLFVIVFSRLLGADGYGALAAIISAFLILMVAGQSVQVAVARDTTLGKLGSGSGLRSTLRRWSEQLLLLTGALTVVGILLRDPLAQVLGTPEHAWAVAALPATGSLWLLLSLQRGALQGLSDFRGVAVSIVFEAIARFGLALTLFGFGLGVAGAYLGTPAAFLVIGGFLAFRLERDIGELTGAEDRDPEVSSLFSLVGANWLPILGLLLLAMLQNVDVIVGRHQFDGDNAGSYAVAAVSAKAVVWVAAGIGLQLLPEATRLHAEGKDPRPAFLRALLVLTVVALPALAIFALVPGTLLRLAFGPDLTAAADALPLLGVAMVLVAIAYLTVQYMIALGELRFVWIVGVIALIEPFLLSRGELTIVSYATIVLGIQLVTSSLLLTLGLRVVRRKPAPA